MYHKLKQYLRNIPVTVTICKALVKRPSESERKNLIYERHVTKIGIREWRRHTTDLDKTIYGLV